MRMPAWIKPGLVGVVFGAILIAIVGFNYWGWTTEGAARDMANEQTQAAITTFTVDLFTNDCVTRAQAADPALLTEIAAETSPWQQKKLIRNAGWATVPGQEEPNKALAEACLAALEDTLAATQEQADL